MRDRVSGTWMGFSRTALASALAVVLPVLHPLGAAEPVVAYTIVDGRAIPESLTGAPGDPARGRTLYETESRADCVRCHGMPGAAGSEAPDLAGVGARLDPGEIRLWLVAPGVLAPETAMPAYYAAGQRTGAKDPLYGGPALTAGEIEDLVAYLAGLEGRAGSAD